MACNRLVLARLLLAAVTLLIVILPALAQENEAAEERSPQNQPQTAHQVEQVLPSYEGQTVTSVELAGRPDLDTEQLKPLLAQQSGQPFSLDNIRQTASALKNLHRFQDVQLEIRPEAKGVRVLFILQPAYYFGIYRFTGIKNFAYSRLLQVASYPPRGAYTPVDVRDAEDGLLTFLRKAGYFEAEITPELENDPTYLITSVNFRTHLGPHAKFGKVAVKGVSTSEERRLVGSIQGLWARLSGYSVRPGHSYKLKTLQSAGQHLQSVLSGQGYLAAAVKLNGASYDPQTNRADIEYSVDPGPKMKVEIAGAHLWPWTRHSLLPIYQQAGASTEILQEGRQDLIDYFQSKGYFDVQVHLDINKQPGLQTIAYKIDKGPRHKVTAVQITGNRHLSDRTLMPLVKVNQAKILGHGKYSEELVRESVTNLEDLYHARGFSEVSVTPDVVKHGGDVSVVFKIKEGPQDIVESLNVVGNQGVPRAQLAPGGIRVRAGQPYSTELVNEDRSHILAHYLELGYLNATFGETVRTAGKDKHRLDVTYVIQEGPRVRTDDVLAVGQRHTRPALILRTAEIHEEMPLRTGDMLAAENRLYSLDEVFDWAEVDPKRSITTQHQEDVLVKVHEAKRNEITYGFGFQVVNRGGTIPSGTVAVPGIPPIGLPSNFKTSQKTFWGPQGIFQYTRRNVRGLGETILVDGLANRLLQRGSFTYTDPHFRWTKWRSDFSMSGEHNSQNPIFTSRMGQFGFQLERPLNPDKTQTLILRYNFRETGLTRLLITDLVPVRDRHVRLSTFVATYIRDTRDNPLDAHKGIYETGELDFNPEFLGSNVSFARFLGQTAYYHEIGGGVVWANSIRLGLEQPFNGSHVPISEKFFSGGGSTLRGFPLNGAGPQHEITVCGNPADISTCAPISVPLGGNELFILNSELRIPTPLTLPLVNQKLGLVAFYDGGNVYPLVGFRDFTALYSNTVGIGFRVSTPVGPLRIDLGHNLNAPAGLSSTQVFVTLGQAF